jgi:A/G-specific adenine glycosylase
MPEGSSRQRAALLTWFDRHKRDLPWRRTRDPYAIWVSEIMLQQTRVAAVLEHYARWMERFPTVAALAAADEAEVLALWSGLGYYRRARFLHAGARAVIADHAGVIPQTASELRKLPGIGEYTSAAIASIAFGEPVAVVDGNVERIAMRLAGLSADERPTQLARAIRGVAADLVDPERPGDSNQAMMELGATVCLPRNPLCLSCPVQPWCATRGEHSGATRKAMQARSIAYTLAQRERGGAVEVLLVQRPPSASLMPGMWELPPAADPTDALPLLTLRHAITVTNYAVSIFASPPGQHPEATWTPVTKLPQTALTGLTRKALKRLELWPSPAASKPQIAQNDEILL